MLKHVVLSAALLAMLGCKSESESRKETQETTGGTAGTTERTGAPTTQPASLSDGDRRFIEEAASGGLMEVQLGEVAARQASSAAVKQFGEHMVDNHSKANDELMQLAEKKGVQVSKRLSAADQEKVDRLARLSGLDFDRAYMNQMVTDHQHDVQGFQKEAQSGEDPDVKAFAARTLPTLEEHLQMATQTRAASMRPGTRPAGPASAPAAPGGPGAAAPAGGTELGTAGAPGAGAAAGQPTGLTPAATRPAGST